MVELEQDQFPILVARWSGDTTSADVDTFFSWLEGHIRRARAGGTRLALINVADTQRSNPEVRRQLTDRAKSLEGNDDVGTWIVLNNLMVRGILTAIQWMDPSSKRNRVVPTYEQALREARDSLKQSA